MHSDFSRRTRLLLLAGLVSVFACRQNQEADRSVLIDEAVEVRLVSFQLTKEDNCREHVRDIATKIVDSLLIERARVLKDSMTRPLKPEKPVKPDIATPLDSTPIQPLFQREK
jgi:hypothetical protein